MRMAHMQVAIAGLVLATAALLAFGFVQTAWFNQHLQCGRLRAFGFASRAMAESVVAVLVFSSLFS